MSKHQQVCEAWQKFIADTGRRPKQVRLNPEDFQIYLGERGDRSETFAGVPVVEIPIAEGVEIS